MMRDSVGTNDFDLEDASLLPFEQFESRRKELGGLEAMKNKINETKEWVREEKKAREVGDGGSKATRKGGHGMLCKKAQGRRRNLGM